MSIIPYNHLIVYRNYYQYNNFNKKKSIKQILSFFCYKYIYDNSSTKI